MTALPAIDLTSRIAVVTGPTSGIGKVIARQLAIAGAHVVLACRDEGRGEETKRELLDAVPGASLEVMALDVSSRASVEAFAAALVARHPAVHVLVNNAGGWYGSRRESVDGVELTLATNAVGPLLLTRALQGALVRGGARVVNVGSHLAGKLDVDDLQIERRRYRGFSDAYSASKEALIVLSRLLHDELSPRGVTVNVAEPGWVRTDSHRHAFFLQRFIMNLAGSAFAKSSEEGADTPTWMALAPELEGVSGRRYQERAEIPFGFADRDPPALAASMLALIGPTTDARAPSTTWTAPGSALAAVVAALVVGAGLCGAAPAQAQAQHKAAGATVVEESSGVSFPAALELLGERFRFVGAGLRSVNLFVTRIRIYAVAHYVGVGDPSRHAFRVVALRDLDEGRVEEALHSALQSDPSLDVRVVEPLLDCLGAQPEGAVTTYFNTDESLRVLQGPKACPAVAGRRVVDAVYSQWLSEEHAAEPGLYRALTGAHQPR